MFFFKYSHIFCLHWIDRHPYLVYFLAEQIISVVKNSIRDVHTPQSGAIVFDTMSYRSKTVQSSRDFQNKHHQLCIGPNNAYIEKVIFKREKNM